MNSVIMPNVQAMFELWHFGPHRCVLTAANDGPPFNVGLFAGDALLALHVFPDHNTATAFAVSALRAAIPPDTS